MMVPRRTALAAAVVTLLGVALATWLAGSWWRMPLEVATARNEPAVDQPGPGAGGPKPLPETDAGRRRMPAGGDGLATAPADPRWVVLGTCVDAATDLPLGGVPVRRIGVTRASSILAEDLGQSEPDGRFRIEAHWVEDAVVDEVFVGGRGWCLRRAWFDDVRPGDERDLGMVPLRPGVEVAGELVDGEGRAIAGDYVAVDAEGIALPVGLAQSPTNAVATDAAGRFELGPLPAGERRLRLMRSDLEIVEGASFTVPEPPAPEMFQRVVVRRLPRVRVHVTDGAGRPIERAVVHPRVCAGGRLLRLLGPQWTDEHGVLDAPVVDLTDGQSVECWSWAAGFRAARAATRWDPARQVEIVLSRGAAGTLRVTDAHDGRPVERFAVCYWEECPLGRLTEQTWPLREHKGGTCEFTGLGACGQLVVSADGYGTSEPVAVPEAADGRARVDVALVRAGRLLIRCRAAGGAPLAGVVEVVAGDGDATARGRAMPLGAAVDALYRGPRVVARAELDRDGNALVSGLRHGNAWIRPVGFWCAWFEHGPLAVRSGETVTAHVRVEPGCSVSGAIVPRDVVAWLRSVRLVGVGDATRAVPSPGQATSLPFEADGTFEWSGLPPGEWRIEVGRAVGAAGRRPVEVPVVVGALTLPAKGPVAIDVEVIAPGTVHGRVAGTGVPAELVPIGHVGKLAWTGTPVAVAADGSFEACLPPAEYRCLARATGGEVVVLGESVAVTPGAMLTVTFTPAETHDVDLVVTQRTTSRVVAITYELARSVVAVRGELGADGRCRLRLARGEPFLVRVGGGRWTRPTAGEEENGVQVFRVAR